MKRISIWFAILMIGIFSFSCVEKNNNENTESTSADSVMIKSQPEIIDCNYTFEEATAGSGAPQKIIDELVLLDLRYYSTDNQIHKGQVLTNKKIADDITEMFDFMLSIHFPIYRAVPIVRYGWDDNRSMAANNTSSFCYRNIANSKRRSKHSYGMAIDINPYFNPIRFKSPNQNRPNIPEGAVMDTTIAGTLHSKHPVVLEFNQKGFRWGHHFRRYFDNHHFEK